MGGAIPGRAASSHAASGHAMDMSPRGSGRFAVSLVVLAVLAVLVWQTMEPGRYQQLTWLLLGLFAFRIVLMRLRSRYSKERGAAPG